MKILKNKDNIQPAQKFNPPTQHPCIMDGKDAGTCFVYDPAAWRNKNRGRLMPPSQPEMPVRMKSKSPAVRVLFA